MCWRFFLENLRKICWCFIIIDTHLQCNFVQPINFGKMLHFVTQLPLFLCIWHTHTHSHLFVTRRTNIYDWHKISLRNVICPRKNYDYYVLTLSHGDRRRHNETHDVFFNINLAKDLCLTLIYFCWQRFFLL